MSSIGCHLIAHLASLPIFKEVARLIRRCWSRSRPINMQFEALQDKVALRERAEAVICPVGQPVHAAELLRYPGLRKWLEVI